MPESVVEERANAVKKKVDLGTCIQDDAAVMLSQKDLDEINYKHFLKSRFTSDLKNKS